MHRKGLPGFTLVEILIVVIIIGILALLVIPRLTRATEDARLSRLTSDLRNVRGQLEVYKTQHAGGYPGLAGFEDQMTGTTDVSGDTDGADFGPYLPCVPINPFTHTRTVGSGEVGSSAWYYNETTGEFRANDSAAHAAY